MKKFLRNKKKDIYMLVLLICVMLLFPYFLTLIKSKKHDYDLGKIESTKRYVDVGKDGKEVKIELNRFIPCALYAVMNENDPVEALKTQIIVIRTYILYKLENEETILATDLKIPYTNFNELEKRWGNKYEENMQYTMDLISDTSNQAIFYEGKYIYPYYHKLSAGKTSSGEYAYLKPVESSEDMEAEKFVITNYFTFEEMCKKINEAFGSQITGGECITKIKVNYYDESMYVRSVDISGIIVEGEEFSRKLGISSNAFVLEEFAGGVKLAVYGEGNGKGISLYCAKKMAEEGKTYREIIGHFYTGVVINKIEKLNFEEIHSNGNVID